MLISNWWQVLKRAWSIRWIALAGLLSGIEVFLPIIGSYSNIPRGLFAALSGAATAAAFVARVLAQEELPDADQ